MLKTTKKALFTLVVAVMLLTIVVSCNLDFLFNPQTENNNDWNGEHSELVTVVNNNIPYFTAEDKSSTVSFERHEPLDSLGRVGIAFACMNYADMPTGERDFTLKTNPTGWVQKRYSIVSGGWLYNRSHMIGYQLTGGEDDPLNLMTGTREFNVDGMLPFENMTADHMRENRTHHVLYRITPDFGDGDNLLAYGILMESDCIECDDAADYCVYIANIQTGVVLNYATGESQLEN